MNIEVATSFEDIPDLLVFVHMSVERNNEHESPAWGARETHSE